MYVLFMKTRSQRHFDRKEGTGNQRASIRLHRITWFGLDTNKCSKNMQKLVGSAFILREAPQALGNFW